MSLRRVVIRFLGSAVLASIVVMAMLVIGLQAWGVFDEEETPRDFEKVRLLSERERLELARRLGEDERVAPPRPVVEEIPRVPLRRREVSGFVQLEVTVAPDGTVEQVDVLDAVPAGVYEDQARQIVRQRRYAPTGESEPSTRIEVVDFTVPADETPDQVPGT